MAPIVDIKGLSVQVDSTVNVNNNLFATVGNNTTLNVPVQYQNGTPVGTIVGGVVEIPNAVTPSGIAYQRPMLTGQKTSYRTGDDAWHLANGTYDYTPPVYPTHYAKLDKNAVNPFITLVDNNVFGNKNRFTDELGGQTYTNKRYIDHYQGLEYYFYYIAVFLKTWDTLIDESALTYFGLSDWRITNRNELESIFNFIPDASFNALTYSPFNLAITQYFYTSNTPLAATANAIIVKANTYASLTNIKTSTNRAAIFVRNY